MIEDEYKSIAPSGKLIQGNYKWSKKMLYFNRKQLDFSYFVPYALYGVLVIRVSNLQQLINSLTSKRLKARKLIAQYYKGFLLFLSFSYSFSASATSFALSRLEQGNRFTFTTGHGK